MGVRTTSTNSETWVDGSADITKTCSTATVAAAAPTAAAPAENFP